MSRLAASPLILVLTTLCGCSTLAENFGSFNPFAVEHVTADGQNPAVEVACIWQPGEGRNGQGIPTRGFSGQVFFFTRRDSEPAIVEGQVRVYLFADRGTPEERAKPLRQFDFAPEAWATHISLTSLGPGYCVFIPYPENEPYQVRCQLRARFTPKEGPVIWSEAVTMTLEGPPRPNDVPLPLAEASKNTSQTVANANPSRRSGALPDATDDSALESRRLRTDTFRLGSIEQTSYEQPQHAPRAYDERDGSQTVTFDDLDAETLRRMLKDSSSRKKSAAHVLDPGSQEETAAASHSHRRTGSASARRTGAASGRPSVSSARAGSDPVGRAAPVSRSPLLARRHPLSGPSIAAPADATIVRADRHPLIGRPGAKRNGPPSLESATETAEAAANGDYGVLQPQHE